MTRVSVLLAMVSLALGTEFGNAATFSVETDHARETQTGGRSVNPMPDIRAQVAKEHAYKIEEIVAKLTDGKTITSSQAIHDAIMVLKAEEESSSKLSQLIREKAGNEIDKDKYNLSIDVFNDRIEQLKKLRESVEAALKKAANMEGGTKAYPPYAVLSKAFGEYVDVLTDSYRKHIDSHKANRDSEQKVAFTEPGCPLCAVGYGPLKESLKKAGFYPPRGTSIIGYVVKQGDSIGTLTMNSKGHPHVQVGPGAKSTPMDLKKDAKLIQALRGIYEDILKNPETLAGQREVVENFMAWSKPSDSRKPASTGKVPKPQTPAQQASASGKLGSNQVLLENHVTNSYAKQGGDWDEIRDSLKEPSAKQVAAKMFAIGPWAQGHRGQIRSAINQLSEAQAAKLVNQFLTLKSGRYPHCPSCWWGAERGLSVPR